MEIAQLVVTILGSSGVTGLGLAILNRKWKKQDKDEEELAAIKEVLKALSIDRINYLGSCYIYEKKIRLEDKENIHRLYDAAKGVGLNGDCDTVIKEVDKLPIKEKQE